MSVKTDKLFQDLLILFVTIGFLLILPILPSREHSLHLTTKFAVPRPPFTSTDSV